MRQMGYFLIPLMLVLLSTGYAFCAEGDQDHWMLQVYGGTAYNFRTQLKIEQSGFDVLDFAAKYKTSGTGAPYYALRVGRWTGDHAWEFEHVHHKLLLDNNPPEVQDFQISHGFNMFMLNRANRRGGLIYRYGGGIVIAHPENEVRSMVNHRRYYLSGVAAQYAVEKRWDISDRLSLSVEGKLTAAWFQVPIEDGHAAGTNIALP